MTTDGAYWKHSRSMVIPGFARTQVADLASFGVHVTNFLDNVPKDGSTVDLQPLFDRLALDSSTELIFGESVQSLAPETPAEAQRFLDAYNYAQKGVGRRMVLPLINIFTWDPIF